MRRLGDAAVTAIVGTALLLAMTMVLFTVLNVVVFSFPVHPRSPSISLVASISDENTIIIEHNGGESLSESEIQIVVSTSSISPFVASGNFYSYNGNINDGEFSIGDYWNSSVLNLMDENVSVTVVHISTNSILMMGNIKRGD